MDLRLDQSKEGPRVDSSESRRSSRIRIQVPVFLRGSDASGAEFIELTKTLNISATGACITSAHLLRPDQTVHLTIPAPSPASSSLIPSETPPIVAKVRRLDFWVKFVYLGWNFCTLLSNSLSLGDSSAPSGLYPFLRSTAALIKFLPGPRLSLRFVIGYRRPLRISFPWMQVAHTVLIGT